MTGRSRIVVYNRQFPPWYPRARQNFKAILALA